VTRRPLAGWQPAPLGARAVIASALLASVDAVVVEVAPAPVGLGVVVGSAALLYRCRRVRERPAARFPVSDPDAPTAFELLDAAHGLTPTR